MKKHVWTVAYALALAAFTAFAALDTFVIPKTYAQAPAPTATPAATVAAAITPAPSPTATIEPTPIPTESDSVFTDSVITTDAEYSDASISISISQYREHETEIYVADVYLADASLLKTALAKGVYGQNVTDKTSVTAESVSAILAVNGDYYGARRDGYVIRNSVLYREKRANAQDDLVIWSDGSFELVSENDVTAAELAASGAAQVFSFGPGLLNGGEIYVGTNDEVSKSKASNPRTAIGIIEPLHYVLVVADGRTGASAGLTLYQLAEFMQSLGVTTAYNLDGGGSSTMYFNGEIINKPTFDGEKITERKVSDIVYIGY